MKGLYSSNKYSLSSHWSQVLKRSFVLCPKRVLMEFIESKVLEVLVLAELTESKVSECPGPLGAGKKSTLTQGSSKKHLKISGDSCMNLDVPCAAQNGLWVSVTPIIFSH